MSHLTMEHVSKGFGPPHARTEVLSEVNLAIQPGEFVAIVGYSGSGKSTLISLLAGLTRPDRGEVALDGAVIEGPGPERGVVFQNYSLLPWLTVYENVQLAVDKMFPDQSPAARAAHIEKYIEMVNLTPARDKRPGELSGGMRQRVSLARTLAIRPKVLLCDEPLGALDALTRANLQDELGRLHAINGQTVVLIINDPDEAILLADRVIPLTPGPGATLGPSFPVNIPRPRNRKALNHDPAFKRLRAELVEFLLKSRRTRQTEVTRTLALPDVEPEDLSLPRTRLGLRRRPVRRAELKEERIEISP